MKAVEEGLKELGWTRGQNIDLDYHWPGAQTAVAAPVMSIAFFAHRARRSFWYKNLIDHTISQSQGHTCNRSALGADFGRARRRGS